MHQNAPFQRRKYNFFSGEGAHPLPRPHPRGRLPRLHSRVPKSRVPSALEPLQTTFLAPGSGSQPAAWKYYYQGCRGYGNSHGYGYGMGMGTVMNSHGTVGILWGFLSGCEIKRKRVNYAINVTVDVWISSNSQIFEFVSMAFLNFIINLSLLIVNTIITLYGHSIQNTCSVCCGMVLVYGIIVWYYPCRQVWFRHWQ